MHGPYAVKKCYLACADRTRVPTTCKQRVAWALVCSRCCYQLIMSTKVTPEIVDAVLVRTFLSTE